MDWEIFYFKIVGLIVVKIIFVIQILLIVQDMLDVGKLRELKMYMCVLEVILF